MTVAYGDVNRRTMPTVPRHRFDDGNGEIEFPEVVGVIQAYNNGDSSVGFPDVVAVVRAYNGDGQWSSIVTGS